MRMQMVAGVAVMGMLAGCALPVSVPDSGPAYAPEGPAAVAPAPIQPAAPVAAREDDPRRLLRAREGRVGRAARRPSS